MRVFVAGASGVIGRAVLAELFAHRHSVIALARTQDKATLLRSWGAEPVPGDLLAPASFQHALTGVDAVCHLASVVPAERSAAAVDWRMNDLVLGHGTAGLLAAARRMGVRYYVQQSAISLYRPQGDAWLDEDAPIDPPQPLAALREAEQTVAGAGLGYAILRAGLYYGPGTRLSARLAQETAQGLLQLPHSGARWISLAHVFDMAKALRLCVEQRPQGRIYNVCDDAPLLEADLVKNVAEAAGCRVEVASDPPPTPGRRASNARLKAELGFTGYYPSALGAMGELRGAAS